MSAARFSTPYKRKKAVPPPATLPAPDDWIARGTAVSFIAQRCKPHHENQRAFRNKVAGNISYAVRNSVLQEHTYGFVFSELITWARQKKAYAKFLTDIPYTQTATVSGFLPSVFGEFRASQIPTSLDGCQIAIVESDRVIAELQKRLSTALAQLEAQRPMVEKYMRLKVLKPKRKD